MAEGKGWDAGLYEDRYAYVWKLGADVIELLAPQPGERVLDIGCGTGHLTAQVAQRGAHVIGIDSSPSMITQARANYPRLRFEVADARDFDLGKGFDAVFSNAALHWVKPAEPAVKRIARALRPGGRFAAEFGGKGNVRAIVGALISAVEAAGIADAAQLSPWYYPSLGEYAGLLERHGLGATYALLFDRPTPLEGEDEGLRNWLRMFAGAFLDVLPAERRDQIIADVEERLRPDLYYDGRWHADYRRLRIVAVKE